VKYSSNPSATPDIAEWTMEISSSWIKSKTYSETITGLKPRTTYYFWIRARDENATNWSVVLFTLVRQQVLKIPLQLPGVIMTMTVI